ncbi:putative bactericidal permeability-increasing protein [Erysiphe necator]|uniref:Putative bactericidal permeability-increasing protein n=1 Tax=Uncinula necator TaxID=52586 RepID=A0A0B1P4J7_UNCNE|nr:putative bactericidal permeability-increasing protein [Erysiphe necator]
MSRWGTRNETSTDDQEPLLAQYDDETVLQKEAHRKMHSYQMIRALFKGYLPSNEQIIINLRALLASDFLNPDTIGWGNSSQILIKDFKQWIMRFIQFLKNKNEEDQIQNLIYLLIHARVSVETGDITQKISGVKSKADTLAVFESIRTIGSLLLTNSEMREFLNDLNSIGRQVFIDVSHTVSNTAEAMANKVEKSNDAENYNNKYGDAKEDEAIPHNLDSNIQGIGSIMSHGATETGVEVKAKIKENFSGEQRKVLIHRLKTAVTKLRQRNDYSDSIKIVSLLIRQYSEIYSRAANQAISVVQNDINTNESLELAMKIIWSFSSSFGDKEVWIELQTRFDKIMEHSKNDPDFELFCKELSNIFEQMFTDPCFFDSVIEKFNTIKLDIENIGTNGSLSKDIKSLLDQIRVALISVANDQDVSQLLETTVSIFATIFQHDNIINSGLITDMYSIFMPNFIQAIQYIPIPRLEISGPRADLLVENLIIEPGHTINHSSFLPFHLKIQLFNELNLHKARFQTVSALESVVKIRLQGISLRAEEVGYWLRTQIGPFSFTDEGIASIEMDKRGMDIELEVEIGKESLEKILTLKDVHIKIHNFTYNLRKSKFSCLAWLLKPLIRTTLRGNLERQLTKSMSDFFHAANRELLFARERLRAARISNPQSLHTFLEAVLTRLKPKDDSDIQAHIGIRGAAHDRGNVFAGRYAPGSVVKLWDREVTRVGDLVNENSGAQIWRNNIFDVQVHRA